MIKKMLFLLICFGFMNISASETTQDISLRGHILDALRNKKENVVDLINQYPQSEIDRWDKENGTLLTQAVIAGHECATRALLEKGANPNIPILVPTVVFKKGKGKWPQEEVLQRETSILHQAVLKYKEIRDEKSSEKAMRLRDLSISLTDEETPEPVIIDLLLQYKANPSFFDYYGKTPLYYANYARYLMKYGLPKVIKCFEKHGISCEENLKLRRRNATVINIDNN